MHPFRLASVSCALAVCISSVTAAQAAPPERKAVEKPEDLPESIRYNYAPVPPELWGAFMDSVKADEKLTVAEELKKDRIEPVIEQWSKEIGTPLQTKFVPFLELIGSRQNVGSLQKEQAPIPTRTRTPAAPTEEESVLLWTYRAQNNNRSYFVPASQAQVLMFPVLHSVSSTHPLNEKIDRFEVDNVDVLEACRRVLKPAGIEYDYAFNLTGGKNTVISLRLSNRSRFDCLRTAVDTSNFELATRGFGNPPSIQNPRIEYSQVLSEYRDQELKAQADAKADKKTPTQILHDRLDEEIKKVRQGRDIVIGLRPRFPTTDVKVNVDESNQSSRGRGR